MKQTFYSNGKLLISGEYLVLDGGTAFSLPTKFGQSLTVNPSTENRIFWKSYDHDGSIWFEDAFTVADIFSNQKKENPVTDTLLKILHEAHLLNAKIFEKNKGFTVETQLTFPRNWGLGTSSTLINNIAAWFKIDAFELLQKSFGGSGYDIANAQNNSAIFYKIENKKPVVKTVDFRPDFTSKIFFVYLNQKQNSKQAIAAYKKNNTQISETILQATADIAKQLVSAKDSVTFAKLLQQYDEMMSPILETPTMQQQLFGDFKGVVKSLGAWGGDFVLAISEENPTEYFKGKGYTTVLPYSGIIL
ncbi:GHMP kinase [Flavobacterium sp. NST-5]|uniref:GHMP kinase n=1 Tax=Flavobacterium ichthyis TaxID=2698827 RepID=A0ABW9Z7H1_9FLAO|nr:GYDIA family GHMP kinase [Flavobacterium ichthyis]NBL64589.1 GHMP kinase [Flavobacterium ichthyis]